MINLIIKKYRILIPESVRTKIYKLFLKNTLDIVRPILFFIKTKCYYIISFFTITKKEKNLIWSFMGKYGKTQYPYNYSLKYKNLDIKINIDNNNSLPYIVHNKKRLYFPQQMSNKEIIDTYRGLLTEQDEESAHRYMDTYDRFNNKTLLDIGSAEGIIALDVIDKIKRVYLFEYDSMWIKALEATFAPYSHKVEIIKKYVSDTDDDNCISLDTFFRDKPLNDLFIKMDIEGAELQALNGAISLLKNAKNLDFSICVYHKEDDIIDIPNFLNTFGYQCSVTKGYLFIGWWLRKGIVRKLL